MSDLARDPHVDAKAKGLHAVLPNDDELFLDIDDRDDFKVMKDILHVLEHNGFHAVEEKRTRSKSGNWHVYLRFQQPLEPMERIALQACMGSDRKREVLSILRCFTGNTAPTVFFEKEPR